MGYHKKDIIRGTYGYFTKIIEEYEELVDAVNQNNKIMMLCEMADLIGAIEGYVEKHCNGITLNDIIKMKEATWHAFQDGTRKSKNS